MIADAVMGDAHTWGYISHESPRGCVLDSESHSGDWFRRRTGDVDACCLITLLRVPAKLAWSQGSLGPQGASGRGKPGRAMRAASRRLC